MSSRRVHFERVSIDRALGIGRGQGFPIDDLSPGINLICGPNGSGKSTTALVIQELLWPGVGVLDRPTIGGTLSDGSTRWQIEIEHGVVSALRDGHAAAPPAFAPAESRSRHHLALHELIGATDRDFAKRIVDAGRGGYDLRSAARALGFTGKTSVPRRVVGEVSGAREAVREAQRVQAALAQRERELDELTRRFEAARAAEGEVRRLERILTLRQAEADVSRLQAMLDALPHGLRRVKGDERDRLDAIATRLDNIDEILRAHRDELDDAERSLHAAALSDEGVDESRLARWRQGADSLRAVEERIVAEERALRQAESRVAEVRTTIGPDVSDETLLAIGLDARQALSDHGHRADRLRAEDDALLARERHLASTAESECGPDAESVGRGVHLLAQWLSTPSVAAPTASEPSGDAGTAGSLPQQIAALLVALLFIVLAIVHQWLWLLGLVAAVVLFLWRPRVERTPPTSVPDERAVHQRAFERLGLAGPEHWTIDAVQHRLDALVKDRVRAESEQARRREREATDRDRADLEQRLAALERDRSLLEGRLGIPIGDDTAWFTNVASAIGAWQQARAEAEAARAALRAARERHTADAARLFAELSTFMGTSAPDEFTTATSLRAATDAIARREASRAAAVQSRFRAQRDIDRARAERETLIEDRSAILAGLDLSEVDDATLDAWIERIGERTRLDRELAEATGALAAARSAVTFTQAATDAAANAPADAAEGTDSDDVWHELFALDEVGIARRLDDARVRSGERDALSAEIAQIRAEVAKATAGHDLEDRMAALDEALAALGAERFDAEARSVGHALVDFVRDIEGDRSRPVVFRRASALLGEFTHGALALDVVERDGEPTLLARSGVGAARPVDALSRGERIQTLMAVRLAFLEQEESATLPLLLDETIATSDDRRAEAIIDTVIAIARGGRQVFCFTAQHDEVAKWQARLEGGGVEFQTHDLATIRRLAVAEARPLVARAPDRPAVPPPGDDDHATYGVRLGVPGLDPWDETQSELHLWHVVDDTTTLHRCLEAGVTTWGQARTLIASHAALVARLCPEGDGERLRERAGVVARACALWRQGRARPIDRGVLAEAEGVSNRFLDRVVELAAECGGDAARLVDSIDSLAGWRRANTAILRDWLIEHGHLDDRPRLGRAELRIRLLSDADTDSAGMISTDFIDRALAGLPD